MLRMHKSSYSMTAIILHMHYNVNHTVDKPTKLNARRKVLGPCNIPVSRNPRPNARCGVKLWGKKRVCHRKR